MANLLAKAKPEFPDFPGIAGIFMLYNLERCSAQTIYLNLRVFQHLGPNNLLTQTQLQSLLLSNGPTFLHLYE